MNILFVSMFVGFYSDEENRMEEIFISHLPTKNPDFQLARKLTDIPQGISELQARGNQWVVSTTGIHSIQ